MRVVARSEEPAIFAASAGLFVNAGLGELTIWDSSQTPHQLRDDVAVALGLPQHKVRVIVPDLGGGFGAKGSTYREDVAVAALAKLLSAGAI